ncbi:FtsX-like permease family protein [Nocardia sp. CNY236]|uniref:FtsX-like permease family protein n=1 Tax=Nocardia sp. CNY236 TaxID=1169152 RepID=UPI000401D62B|nr:ABC transporter permease [Nocardia sp. CNY236]
MIRSAWDRLRLFNIGELLVHRGRTAMALLVIAVSASLLFAVLSVAGSVSGSVDQLARGLGGDAQLEVTGFSDSGFDQELLPTIAATPGVAVAVPMVRTQLGTGEDRTLLVGAGPNVVALGSELTGPITAAAGKLLSVPNGVLVGDQLGRSEGDRFTVGTTTVTVAGVLDARTSRKLNSGRLIVAPLGLAQKMSDRIGRLDSVEILLADDADVAPVRAALTTAVGDRSVVADSSLRSAQVDGPIHAILVSTTLASLTALIVAAFLIYNVMNMALTQRRPMLSLLRALGGKRGPLARDLLVEAALLGLLGAVIGTVLGVLMGRIAIDILPPSIVAETEARIEYMVPWYVIWVVTAACVVTTVTATGVAVRQVYRVQPVEALAPVGVSPLDTTHQWVRWASGALGAVLIGVSLPIAFNDLGNVSMATLPILFMGAIPLCFAFGEPITRAASGITRWFGAPGALGATTLERAPQRVWATVMTVMVVFGAIVGTHGVNSDGVQAADRTFIELDDFDAYVSPTRLTQFPTGPLLPATVKDEIAEVPGVSSVVPAQMAFATLGASKVLLEGYLPEHRTATMHMVSDDAAARLFAGDGVVLSRGVARDLGVTVGAELTLPTPTGPHPVRVLDVVPYFTGLAEVVMIDLDLMRSWYERPGETFVSIHFDPQADPEAVQAAIRHVVPPTLNVESGTDAVSDVTSAIRQSWQVSQNILWIVVVAATVALLNTLMLSVLERRRELGVLRAMGTARRFLIRSVLAEAAGMGLVGAMLGLGLGLLMQVVVDAATGHALAMDVEFHLNPQLLGYGLLVLVLVLLGSFPPAIRVGRMAVVEALAVD